MRIKKVVNDLFSKYQTKDPFKLCQCLGIVVVEEPLGTINGYYNEVLGVRFIHINSGLATEYQRKLTVAHELGHAVLHPGLNCNFLKKHTLFNIDRFEKEANSFAVHLLLDEEEENLEAAFEISSFYGFDEKIKNYLNKWGVDHEFCEYSQTWG